MKKRVMALLLAAVTVFAMTGCGGEEGISVGKKKAPSLEDLKGNFSDEEVTSFDVEGSLSVEANVEYDNLSDTAEMIIGMLEDEIGCDLSDGSIDASASIDFSGNGVKNDDYSYAYAEGSLSVDCSIDEIMELIEDELDGNDEFSTERFVDYDEEIVYMNNNDEGWDEEDYEESEDELDVNEVLESLVDFCIVKNDNADKDDEIKVESVKDGYSLKLNLNIDNDYLSDIDDDELDALQDLLDVCNIDYDIEDLTDYYEEYSDYAEVAMPLSIEIIFVEEDKEYVITGVNVEMSLTVSGSWDQDTISEIAGEDLAAQDIEFDLDFSAEIKLVINVTVGYDEEDVDVPKDLED